MNFFVWSFFATDVYERASDGFQLQLDCQTSLLNSMWISDNLSQWEKNEIDILDGIWFVTNSSSNESSQANNETDFDGEKGRYKWKLGNHINYRFGIFHFIKIVCFIYAFLIILRFRYEIIKYLGGGTYGEVVKAFDHKFDAEVAIKILNNGHSESRTNAEFETVKYINHYFPKSSFFVRNIENFHFRSHFCMVFELLGWVSYSKDKIQTFLFQRSSIWTVWFEKDKREETVSWSWDRIEILHHRHIEGTDITAFYWRGSQWPETRKSSNE